MTMISLPDFKTSIPTIEFSLFFQQSCSHCPNCGHLLDNNLFSEVKLSSIVLLLGVGSVVCYKLMIEKKKRNKSRFPFGFAKAIKSQNIESIDEKDNSCDNSKKKRRYKMLTSTPFVDLVTNIESQSMVSIPSSRGSEIPFSFDDIIDETDSSLQTPSFHMIGDKTVAKLDQLLNQIQDIKQSVYEIDEQIFDVKDSVVKFEPKMFILGPDLSSSLTTESDVNEKSNYFNTDPQTPTLEWDLTDLNGIHQITENQLMSSLNSSYLRQQSFNHILEKTNDFESNGLESPQDLSSPTISTSGHFSTSSGSDGTKDSNLATIQRMITDAKKLGLLDDLINILIKGSKRDSAYFED